MIGIENMWEYLLLVFVALNTALNCLFYIIPTLKLSRELKRQKRDKKREIVKKNALPSQKEVSIVIAARNEAHNLAKSLDRFLNQRYRCFEIVVCNDNSTDQTASLLESYASLYPTLRPVTESKKTHPGKKKALATAIANSKGEWLLATDGDCTPASEYWISRMKSVQDAETEIVLGYAPYEKREGWLNKWIRYEALYTAVQYLSSALVGRPYMGVGRNLMYKKTLFDSLNGFTEHEHLTGGDDDLFVNAAANFKNTKVCLHPDTWMYSPPKETWSSYQRQKKRHLSVSHHYKLMDKIWLALLAGSHVFHYIGVLLLLILGYWKWGFFMYCFRMLFIWLRMGSLAGHFNERDLRWLVPVLDLAVMGYYLNFVNTITNTKHTTSWQ